MSNFIKKISLSEKRKTAPWDFKKMVEVMSGKSFEEVEKEQKEKRENKEQEIDL